ncbi:MAG: glycosyltransferase, partial [Thiobacillus sp.]
MRKAYAALGWRIENFRPTLSSLGDIEALLRPPPRVDLVHVPCFRQRDLPAAVRYARRHGIRILFDPLISSYDKQVFERQKISPESPAARRLLAKERKLFQSADRLIADTPVHADFFAETLGVRRERLSVVYVGAEEPLFSPGEASQAPDTQPLEVLFYGSFIPLHGAEVITEAAQLYEGPPVHWWFIGNGPARKRCEASLHAMDNVTFEDWVDYRELPARIRHADVVLGIFGTTQKAGRVIP